MSNQSPRLVGPVCLAFCVTAISLVVLGGMLLGAHSGLPYAITGIGLIWLATVGLPSSAGVAIAATSWGHTESMTGLGGFLLLAIGLALFFQMAVGLLLARAAAKARLRGCPWTWRRLAPRWAVAALFALVALWITQRPLTHPPTIIDGHAHLFGDGGWPPVHQQTCGLSPAQKANPSYKALTRLLRLPSSGNVDDLYVEALVHQAQEARQKLGSFRAVLLAQDCRYNESGEPDWANSSVYVPNARLFQVTSNHPDLFLPCPSINPQRKDWQAELSYCLSQGARVLKIHPPTQAVDPSDPKFREFYRQCARNGMALMVHTGSEHSAPISSPTLGDPRLVRLALEEGCTVIAAHAGTKGFFDPPDEDHFGHLAELMEHFPRLYADSAVLGSLFRWRCIPAIIESPAALPRMLHASDWPFPANPIVFWHRLHPFTLLELSAERNLFIRDARLKLALGMPAATFQKIQQVLHLENEAASLPIPGGPESRLPEPVKSGGGVLEKDH
ncbi:MAG: amidohydrolase family protein [Verrucomicrobiales bacterium]|nr:amidohydrolase family protein [Verrucomicrobiales bacterium]